MTTSAIRHLSSHDHGIARRTATPVMRVALAGCGVVGSALVRELAARRDALAERHGIRVQITSVLVRDLGKTRDATLAASVFTDDVHAFLAADADVVIEAIGGLDPAHLIVRSALDRGRRVITANKALLAAHGSELTALAALRGGSLRHDAAVGGGVPVLRLLDDALGAGAPVRVEGILNGTSNYVLSRLEEGVVLEDALIRARAGGFAEADATRDLDGRDAADKLALIAWTAFGVAPEALRVERRSLLPDPARFVSLANRVGGCLRQVADVSAVEGEVFASVEPVIVAPSSGLARTRDEQNRVDVHTGWSAPLSASGPGAGGLPTATALLSDLVATGRTAFRAGRARTGDRDPRTYAWAIEVAGSPASLHRHVPACGLVHTDASASCAWTVIAKATRADVQRIVNAVEQDGGSVIIARIDDAVLAVTA